MPVRPRTTIPNASRNGSAHQNGGGAQHTDDDCCVDEACVFEAVFRTYHGELCVFARRLVTCRQTAEDVVGDVFLEMWKQRERRERRPARIRTYLYNAVRNHALKHLAHRGLVRKWKSRWQEQGRAPGMGERSAEADGEFQARELFRAFRQALNELPERCREAYTLRHKRGLSYAEIAEVMGISVRTVETQLVRADKALRRQLATWL